MTAPSVVVDQHRVHIRTGGVTPAATAPTIVLVHGAGMDGTVWAQQTRFLSMRGVRALAIDLPGHGQSEGPALLTVEAMADWLAQVLNELGAAKVVIAGHSMGTFIALEMAARYPNLVKSIALFGTATGMSVHPDLLDAAAHDVPRAASLMTGWSHASASRIGVNPTPGMWMTGGVQALVERSGRGVLLRDLNACVNYKDAQARAASITCPALVTIGLQDKMTPAKSGRSIAKALVESAGVEVVELDGAGHMMITEEPRIVREALLRAVKASS